MNKQQTLLAGLVLLGISTAQSAPMMPMNNFGTGFTPWNTAPGGYSPWNNGFNNGWNNGGYNGYPTGMFGMSPFGNGSSPWGNGSNNNMPWNAWRSGSGMPWSNQMPFSNFSNNGFNMPWGGGYNRGSGSPWGNGFNPWNSGSGRNNQFGNWNNNSDALRNRWLMQGMPNLPPLSGNSGAPMQMPMYSAPPQPQQQVQQKQAATPQIPAQVPRPFNAFAPQPKSAQQGMKPGPAMPANIPAFRDPFADINEPAEQAAPAVETMNSFNSQPQVQLPEQSQLQFPPDDLFK